MHDDPKVITPKDKLSITEYTISFAWTFDFKFIIKYKKTGSTTASSP